MQIREEIDQTSDRRKQFRNKQQFGNIKESKTAKRKKLQGGDFAKTEQQVSRRSQNEVNFVCRIEATVTKKNINR